MMRSNKKPVISKYQNSEVFKPFYFLTLSYVIFTNGQTYFKIRF